MTKAFSGREKEIIRKKLIEKGKEFLGIYGIKKTSVEDLTKAVGISKGAFYAFYATKEELFWDILEEYEKEIKSKMLIDISQPGKTLREIFKEFLKEIFLIIENSPMFKLLNSEEVEYLMRKLPPEKLQEHYKNDDSFAIQLYGHFREIGILVDKDPKVIAGFFRGIAFMCLHKKDIGEDVYPEVIEMMTDMISNYLVKE